MPLAKDLLHPTAEEERRRHKKKRLVQSPNSYFMDVKCPGCYKITTVFSHAQTVVLCVGCSTVLCQPTGGKARLTEACLRPIVPGPILSPFFTSLIIIIIIIIIISFLSVCNLLLYSQTNTPLNLIPPYLSVSTLF
ncbi:hypothetical protein QTP86_029401 [Hemibagrus guttatus]|nr:hypothetical protein QTP86_029401 [Hemibagrus guttatus]